MGCECPDSLAHYVRCPGFLFLVRSASGSEVDPSLPRRLVILDPSLLRPRQLVILFHLRRLLHQARRSRGN
eukprot:6015135-Pyramimonas_sp.AAC.1